MAVSGPTVVVTSASSGDGDGGAIEEGTRDRPYDTAGAVLLLPLTRDLLTPTKALCPSTIWNHEYAREKS